MRGPRGICSGFVRACLVTAGFAAIVYGFLPGTAMADLISGNAEWSYSLLDTRQTKGAAAGTETKTDSFNQKYNIALAMNPYPHLRFTAGSLFELDRNSSEMDGFETTTSAATIFPYADLTLATPLYSTGVGYSRKQDTSKGTLAPRTTTINEEYHAVFGWKPEGFPTTSVRLTRTNNFDADKLSSNSTTDYASLGLRYTPLKGLDLRYQATYNNTMDKINDVETSTLTNNGAASYSALFFKQRVSLYSSYNFTRQDSASVITFAGQGSISLITLLFPFSALSNYSTPDLVTSGATDQNAPNSLLIDGDFAASAGINLGVVPFGGDPTKQWSMGVDFGTNNSTEVNTFLVWVDRELPAAIAGAFNWQIYVRNTENENWSPGPAVSGVTFGSSLNSSGQVSSRFQITFANVTTRFIKVVVNTLDQGVAIANPSFQNPGQINVTELQAAITSITTGTAGQEIKSSTSLTSHFYTLDVRTRILNSPSLFHSFSLLLSTAGTSGSTRYTVSNSLNLSHRLSRIFTVGANAGFELAEAAATHNTAFAYNASVKATPLRGLSHTLLYSGRTESAGGGRTDSNSVFLYNSIQPYRGISFNLSGGLSESTSSTGGKTENIQFITGASVAPMKALSMNLSYSRNKTTTSGGVAPPSSTSTQTGSLSASYRAFPSLYLLASFGISGRENTKTQYTQNYGLNWSPFSDGDLQFNFIYSESLSTSNDTKNTLISPSISWRITPRTLLDVSYPIIFTESTTQSSETTVLSATLRTSF